VGSIPIIRRHSVKRPTAMTLWYVEASHEHRPEATGANVQIIEGCMSPDNDPQMKWFRRIALAEGWSVILLFFGAMPVKYLLGEPRMVQVVGSIHGVLFLLFMGALAAAHLRGAWGFRRTLMWCVLSVLPGGTIWGERQYLRE
jgi:integral membrane protein